MRCILHTGGASECNITTASNENGETRNSRWRGTRATPDRTGRNRISIFRVTRTPRTAGIYETDFKLSYPRTYKNIYAYRYNNNNNTGVRRASRNPRNDGACPGRLHSYVRPTVASPSHTKARGRPLTYDNNICK